MATTPDNQARLAALVATRTTELQRTYDRACADYRRLGLERVRLDKQLIETANLIAQCRQRAQTLGCPDLL